jgi:hypothetical protein
LTTPPCFPFMAAEDLDESLLLTLIPLGHAISLDCS